MMPQVNVIRVVKAVLPYPPSANAYWRIFMPPRGPPRIVVTKIAETYKALVADMLAGKLAQLLQGPLLVEIDVFRPRRSRDLSNNVKVMEDALQGVLFVNDSQVVRMKVEHWDTEKHDPRVQVTVTEDFTTRMQPPPWRIRPEDRAKLEHARARLEALAEKEREKRRAKEAAKVSRSLGAGRKVDFNAAMAELREKRPSRPPAGLKGLARPASYPGRGGG